MKMKSTVCQEVSPKYSLAKDFIAHIPELFSIEGQGEVLDMRRNKIKVFNTQWGEWVVKSYKVPMLFQRVIYTFFRKTKASRAFAYAGRLRKMGLDSPEPVAYIEIKNRWIYEEGYFIYSKCNDPFVYPQLVDIPHYDKSLADAVAGFLAEIHSKGVKHGDLNLTNILYRREGDHYHFTIIDINRCKFKRHLTKEDCYNDLRRVTHRRDLYDHIIAKYASLRGWGPDKAVARAEKALDRFEAKESIKGAWKDMKAKTNS
jgi:tRNA A-37 threonylcarbamoyl transferase component Bud32